MQDARQKSQLRQVELGWDGDHAVLSLAGELDVATAPELRSAIGAFFEHPAAPGATLVIDLAAVTFVDSTTLGVLVGAIRMAEQTTSSVVIRNQAPAIQRVFELTGLTRLLATSS
jgi:anti-sigma B factor antagonist